ncbi:MAG: serine/threonine protein kinase [Polyangiaceae bacterium]|nr:serine/threonine protein kinase [Polyangiaceae bacterium]
MAGPAVGTDRNAELWHELRLPDGARGLAPRATIRAVSSGDEDASITEPSDRPPTERPSEARPVLEALPLLRIARAGEDPEGADLELDGELGAGGMGVVWRARQPLLDREVAVKMLHPQKRRRARAVRKLLDEARIAARLDHPGVVPIYALGADGEGDPVVVMKRVEGVGWRELIERADHPRWARVPGDRLQWHLGVLLQVCHAIELAHSRDVIHRDLKPDNVMIGDFGEVYVLDWGLAVELTDGAAPPSTRQPDAERRGEAGRFTVAGTPAYMAPEMVNREPVTVQSDVYLLGSVLHEVLTGEPRHKGDSFFDLVYQIHVSEPAVFAPSVPVELGAICNRATARRPEDRYPSVAAFREALELALEHRASERMADQALGRLRELEKLRARRPDAEAEQRRLATECRFGLQQALESWPDNARARAGLVRALGRFVELELERRNLAAAEALAAELGDVPPDLAARLERLRAEERAEKLGVERLARIAHGHDINVLGRARGLQLLVLCALALAASGTVVVGMRVLGWELGYGLMFPLGAASPLAILGLMLVTRARGARNVVNRRLVTAFLLITLFAILVRWLGYRVELPVKTMLLFELAACACGGTMVVVTLDPSMWKQAVGSVSCAVLAGVFPELAVELTVLGTVGMLAWVGLAWLRRAGASDPSDPESRAQA